MPSATPQPTIACPNCGEPVRLTDALAAPLVEQTRRDFEQRLRDQQQEFAQKEQQMRSVGDQLREQRTQLQAEKQRLAEQAETQARSLVTERGRIADEVARLTEQRVADELREQLAAERKSIAETEAKRAQQRIADELAERDRVQREQAERLTLLQDRLTKAQSQEADLLRRQQELEDRQRAMTLEMEREVQGRLEQVRATAAGEAEQRLSLQLSDKDRAINDLRDTIEQLQRKAQQGSQQAQGETLELLLEDKLRRAFPFDQLEPVAKGESGADILQVVRDESGRECGRILWELKRTKNWSPAWLPKLRSDQRNAQADLAVLISQALPPEIQHFNEVEGVWVSSIACTLPVATAMRHALIKLGSQRRAQEGQQTKSEMVYQYLTGPHFRARLTAISERWNEMRADLEAERRFTLRQWAKREKQLSILLESTEGINGDLQAIAGSDLPEIQALEPAFLLE